MTKKTKEPIAAFPSGTTGLKHSHGYIYEEYIPDLRGRKAMRVFRDMTDNDPVINALGHLIESLIRQVDWRLEPASDKSEAQAEAEFVDGMLYDMERSWTDTLSETITFKDFGFSWVELEYKYRHGDSELPWFHSNYNDGRIGWRNWLHIAQESLERWELDDRGGVIAMVQRDPNTGETNVIPRDKSLHFRLRAIKNNPEGRSMWRGAYRPWFLRCGHEDIEAIGAERDLAGLPVMEIPPEACVASPSQELAGLKTHYEKQVRVIRRNQYEGVVIPSEMDREGKPTGFKLRLLASGGSRQINVGETIKRLDQRIAIVALGDFILLGQQQVGSYALADSKTSTFALTLEAILNVIEEEINRTAIPKVMVLNGVPRKYWPQLKHGDLEKIDFTALASFVSAMVQSGILIPSDKDNSYVRDLINFPNPEGGFDSPQGKKELPRSVIDSIQQASKQIKNGEDD